MTTAAWSILAESGTAGLSMRKLADKIGIKASTLYWHFPNKAAVLTSLINEVTEEAVVKFPTQGDWQDRLLQSGLVLSRALRERPYSAELMMSLPPRAHGHLQLIDKLLEIVDPLALTDEEKFYAVSIYLDYVLTFERDFLIQQQTQDNSTPHHKEIEFPTLQRIYGEGLFHTTGTTSMLTWGLSTIIAGINEKQHTD
ncbi:TetR/AcrR family transcriptional regulator C-terminal domain-containing protein [Lacticaseibacillus pabuli]|uniref:TetR/AcrR family transcriptional regulator C-terminal domain-containing protein n=1 Tax=Lacticaseibacillus pabuli TaxID=3025672 RepID=A0ABY7WVJ6_9LACO|nr:TetR/AcrR family transcriptional regulator C-terminal domain-containing protein [Lacticaseibacillus sp. KACC 23028]WDF83809.1 TetR/AcrR family transcriptional regulator C-terminal domain-containing protein [Lacticaseibacillus sp. KACC 23028]